MGPAASASAVVGQLEQRLQDGRLELPVLPEVATAVLSACQSDTTDAARLSSILHRDPALAASVLRVANSAAHGGRVACASLQQAVGRLGLRHIAEIAVAVAVKSRVFGGAAGAEAFARLWRHSVLAGCFAREIARMRRRNVETAFLCGLLHDVGKAVLLANALHCGDGQSGGTPVDVAGLAGLLHERHEEVGGQLAQCWRLPAQIEECIRHHHDWSAAREHPDAAMSVCLADLLAHVVDLGGTTPIVARVLGHHPVLLELNLYPDQLAALLTKADEMRTVAEGLA